MGQSIVHSEIKAEVPLENDDPAYQNLLLQRYEERIERLSQENRDNSMQRLVVNTLFQEVTDHHNQKDGSR